MRKQHLVNQILSFLDLKETDLSGNFYDRLDDNIEYELIKSSNVPSVSKNIVCKNWKTYDNRGRLNIETNEEILYAYPWMFNGKDTKEFKSSGLIKSNIVKTSFKIDDILVVLKKTIIHKHLLGKTFVKYTVICYKFDIMGIGVIKNSMFDFEKQCRFYLKYWSKPKRG